MPVAAVRAGLLFFAMVLAAAPARACPVCRTGTGRQVRAGIVGDDLGPGVLATVLPFAVVAGVTAAIHFGGRGRERSRGRGH